MNVLLVGDTHGMYIGMIERYLRFLEKKEEVPIQFVIQVGDFGFYSGIPAWERLKRGYNTFSKPTYVVYGNHENMRELQKVWDGKISVPNLSLFPYDGGLMMQDGIVMLGVGGGFTPTNAVHDGVIQWDDDAPRRAEEVWRSAGSMPIDILITHEAPNAMGPIGDSQFGDPLSGGKESVRTLNEHVHPKLHICGHYHKEYDYRSDDMHVRILPPAAHSATVLDTETGRLHVVSARLV